LTKTSQGYEALAGRPAAYILGYLQQHLHHDLAQAQDYYRLCLVFSETIQLTTGYYLFASATLGDLAAQQQEVATCPPLLCASAGTSRPLRARVPAGAGLLTPSQPTRPPVTSAFFPYTMLGKLLSCTILSLLVTCPARPAVRCLYHPGQDPRLAGQVLTTTYCQPSGQPWLALDSVRADSEVRFALRSRVPAPTCTGCARARPDYHNS
jgi:hypothetical protein